jgi:hypothetical protein
MEKTQNLMKLLFKKCDISYSGQLISKETLLKKYSEFLVDSFCKDSHNIQVVLHTGSICFDIITILTSAISNITFNENTVDDIVDSLKIGEMVLYGIKVKKRYIFNGVTDRVGDMTDKYAILDHQKSGVDYIPYKLWRYIEPYYGDSVRTDGRGLRKKKSKRKEFLEKVFGSNEESISNVIDSSSIVVMNHSRANEILNNTVVIYDENKKIKLLDIITASFYTENTENTYSGNLSKAEPLLKITNNVSVARDLVFDKSGNMIRGLSILGSDVIKRGRTELPELMNRKTLKYVTVACCIDSNCCFSIIDETNEANVFSCTKGFLKNLDTRVKIRTDFTKELHWQVQNIRDHEIKTIVLKTSYNWNKYEYIKRVLLSIRYSEMFDEYKNEFVMYAYSLLNLLTTAIFSINRMEELISKKIISKETVRDWFEKLYIVLDEFYDVYKEKAKNIMIDLEQLYDEFFTNCPKEDVLISILNDNRNKSIALVVPKAYYSTILSENSLSSLMNDPSNLKITTANKFDNSIIYDIVITTGDFTGSHFSTFRCFSSSEIIVLIYDYEENYFMYKQNKARKKEGSLDVRLKDYEGATVNYDDLLYEDSKSIDYDISVMESVDGELDEYIKKINESATLKAITQIGNSGTQITLEAVKLGTFTSGQKILFSKAYRAYVFDSYSGEIVEKEISKIIQGDTLVFTKNTAVAKDIVDEILKYIVNSENINDEVSEAYKKSRYWKTVLKDYINFNDLSYNDISRKMRMHGVSRTEQAIRTWLDEDTHIVGPKDEAAYKCLGMITGDELLIDDYKNYCIACKKIRRVRFEILKLIGITIIDKLSGKAPGNDLMQRVVYDNIDNLAEILQLDLISDIESMNVPINIINHPISIQGE